MFQQPGLHRERDGEQAGEHRYTSQRCSERVEGPHVRQAHPHELLLSLITIRRNQPFIDFRVDEAIGARPGCGGTLNLSMTSLAFSELIGQYGNIPPRLQRYALLRMLIGSLS